VTRQLLKIDGASELDVLTLGDMFYRETRQAGQFDGNHFLAYMNFLLANGHAAMWVSMEGIQIVGGIAGLVSKSLFNSKYTATEVFWYIRPEHRCGPRGIRIFRTFEDWAIKSMGATRIISGHVGHDNPMREMYMAMGYRPYESQYIREL
jgi:hypothetical protein